MLQARHTAALLAAGIALSIGAGQVQAATLFDNGVSSGPQTRTANDPGQRLYENFTLGTASQITGFRWAQHDRQGEAYDHTTIAIYAGLPEVAAPVYSVDVVASRIANGTGTIFGVFDGYSYAAGGLSLTLAAGTYWLGFIDAGNNRSGWDDTAGGPDTIQGYRVINENFPVPGVDRGQGFNLAFEVIGSPVPEPASAALLLAGLGLLGAGRYARRSRPQAPQHG